MPLTPPSFDEELSKELPSIRTLLPVSVLPTHIPGLRASNLAAPSIDTVIEGRALVHHRFTTTSVPGLPSVEISVFAPIGATHPRPAVYFVHGGGLVMGNRFNGSTQYLRWAEELGVIVVTVEYRLAPENAYPAAHDDCFNGLNWLLENARELGIDPARVAIVGVSAGGGLAAGVILKRRDLALPLPVGQMLIYPMLDDRNQTVSSRQIRGIGVWDRVSNQTGWNAYLGPGHVESDVDAYAAPSRATDFSNVPPAFIDVGTADVFRDEAVSYAQQIWACGGNAELHVWPGAFHGFDVFVPEAEVSKNAMTARLKWLRRVLQHDARAPMSRNSRAESHSQ